MSPTSSQGMTEIQLKLMCPEGDEGGGHKHASACVSLGESS